MKISAAPLKTVSVKNRIFVALAIVATIIFAGFLLFNLGEAKSLGDKTLVRIGQFQITEQMVKDRDALIRQRAANETRSLGLQQLKNAYTLAQILINNGHPIDDSVLQKEEERVDRTTLMPEKLQAIKNIFGDRKDDYRKVFILPVYAERVIYYEFFLNNETVQAESLRQANQFLGETLSDPASWQKRIQEEGLLAGKANVSLSAGFEFIREEGPHARERGGANPDGGNLGGGGIIDQSPKSADQMRIQKKFEEEQSAGASEEGKKWIEELIKPTKPGHVINKVINRGESGWMITKYIGPDARSKNAYNLEYVIFKKRDYAEWLESETQKILR